MASFQSMQLQPLDLGPRAIDHADTQLLDDLAIRRRHCACSSGPVCSTASVASKTDSSRRAIRTRARRQGTPAAASACASSRCGRAYGQCIAWHRTARSPTWPSPWAASRQRLEALRISQRANQRAIHHQPSVRSSSSTALLCQSRGALPLPPRDVRPEAPPPPPPPRLPRPIEPDCSNNENNDSDLIRCDAMSRATVGLSHLRERARNNKRSLRSLLDRSIFINLSLSRALSEPTATRLSRSSRPRGPGRDRS